MHLLGLPHRKVNCERKSEKNIEYFTDAIIV